MIRSPFPFDLGEFVARCEGLSCEDVINLALREDARARSARHRVSGRGARDMVRNFQQYEDAMGRLLNILRHGGPAYLDGELSVLQPLVDRLNRSPKQA